MKKRILLLGLVCSYVLVFLGCAESSKNTWPRKTDLLEPQATLKFSDLPVPSGFRYSSQDSYSFESGGLRLGVLRYQGKANPEAVVTFYKEQMPLYNWTLLNIMGYGDQLMNFDRDTETCTVVISAKGRHVKITLSVGPKASAARRPEKLVK